MSCLFRPSFLIALLGLAACHRVAPSSVPSATESPEKGAFVKPMLRPAPVPGEVVVVGELHGTAEVPELIGRLAAEIARRQPVILGLELPAAEQSELDAVVAGKSGAVAALLATPTWSGEYRDGRTSKGMLALIESLAELRGRGATVDVIALDPVTGDRDRGMADRMKAAMARRPGGVGLVLVGNLHARTRKFALGDREMVPMAAYLVEAGGKVSAFDLRHEGGSAWFCTSARPTDCGARSLSGALTRPESGDRLRTVFEVDDSDEFFTGVYYPGTLSASPPAAPLPPELAQAARLNALAAEGSDAYARQDWATCAERFESVARAGVGAAGGFYNAACCRARLGETEAALALLEAAVESGFDNREHLAGDPDLESLRGHERFRALLE